MSKPENLIGKQIDQFSLEAFIAKGAMGMVFKAFDSVLARTVALKLIPKLSEDGSSDSENVTREEARKRLIQEAKAAGKLTQPNIVTIHSYGETDEFQYICMEYISGKTLAQELKEQGEIPVDQAIPIFEQVLLALEAADQEGIVHRDIKPSNIMITRNNQVKVMDFGIAKLPSLSMTVTGMVLGTPYYMSPEQISGKKVDIRSDIFSLGAVIYEILTGAKPFEGESTATLTYKIIQQDPIPPNVINRLVPDPIAAIISKALSKDPAKRYQNPTEMLNDLRSLSRRPVTGVETVVSAQAPFESTVLADRLEGSKQQSKSVSPSDLKPGAGRDAGVEQEGELGDPHSADKEAQRPGASKSSREKGPDETALKGKEAGVGQGKKEKRSSLPGLVLAAIVIIAGVVFAVRYFGGKAPQDTGKLSSQPPSTIQETMPPVKPQPVESRPKPTAEQLLLDAGKQFTSDPERAQKLLEQALSLEPNNYDCALSLARLLSYRKDYAAAVEEYQHALRLDNRAADVHYELGSLYLGQGEYDSAIHSLENALILMPKNRDDILASLGFCHFKKGDFAQARLLLKQSLDLNPDNSTAKAFMASLPTPTTEPPATLPPTTQPPATHPPTTQPPATRPPATKPPPTQPPAQVPPKTQGAEVVAGRWDYSITIQGGQVVTGQIEIDPKGDKFQMIATASYRMMGQDGLYHQFREKNYFSGTFHGQNLAARCDKADFTMDGRPTAVPGLPLQLSLVLHANGLTMQGVVSNSLGVSAPVYVRKR
jgi:eukaryotic-like serine/threonine-protein kinase